MMSVIFRALRQFWLGFTVSATAMVMAAIISGDMQHTDIRDRVNQVSQDYQERNPEGLETRLAEFLALRISVLTAATTGQAPGAGQAPRANSIEALQARQG